MKVRWGRRALAQIEEIEADIRGDDPRAVSEVVARFQSLAALLGDAPLIGQATDRADVRSILARPYPYRLFYRIAASEGELRILRVRHSKRRSL